MVHSIVYIEAKIQMCEGHSLWQFDPHYFEVTVILDKFIVQAHALSIYGLCRQH